MSNTRTWTGVVLLLSFFSLLAQDTTYFEAHLTGYQSRLPVLTIAHGNFQATLIGDTFTLQGQFSELTSDFNANASGGAHIHVGKAGQNGGIAFNLNVDLDSTLRRGTFSPDSNRIVLTADEKNILNSRGYYINIHTAAYPGGEIRGQIVPVADAHFQASLTGSQQSVPVMSDGAGLLYAELHDKQLILSGTVFGLSSPIAVNVAGGFHIHSGIPGQNGGIVFNLTGVLNADSLGATFEAANNTFVLTDEQISQLSNAGLYVNVHTLNFTGGEIRGQILPVARAYFRSFLTGTQQSNPVLTLARGQILGVLGDSTLQLTGLASGFGTPIRIDINGGGHVHQGMAGSNGSIIFPLTLTLNADSLGGSISPANNTFSVDSAQIAHLLNRNYYLQVHTASFPGGEARGQLLPLSQYYFHAYLTGSQEVSPRQSEAFGHLVAEKSGTNVTVSGSFTGLKGKVRTDISGGAHLHLAPAGSNGPIAFPLTLSLNADSTGGQVQASQNRFTLSGTQVDTLQRRLMYANIHTAVFAPGEIRGQLLPDAIAVFISHLGGESMNNVNTKGEGIAITEYTGARLITHGSFNNLSSKVSANTTGGAHIHYGIAGRNGAILFNLNSALNQDSTGGVFAVRSNVNNPSQTMIRDTLFKRLTYVNIHTLNFGGGELRGQLLPYARNYYTATLTGLHETTPVISTGRGKINVESTGNRIIVTGSVNNLLDSVALSVAGGSHLHGAKTGLNGGIANNLNITLDTTYLNGVYLAENNNITLDATNQTALQEGGLYVNVHTNRVRSGEVRGQLLPSINLYPDRISAFITPASTDTVTVSKDSDSLLIVSWAPVSDADGQAVVYLWQLSLEPSFAFPLSTLPLGTNNLFALPFGQIDSVLNLLGIQNGQSIKIYHRVFSSDGSLITSGALDSLVLERGEITSVIEFLPNEFTANLYPNPVQEVINLALWSKESVKTDLSIISYDGRKIFYASSYNFSAGQNQHQIPAQQLPPGFYQLFISKQGRPLTSVKFLKL